MGRGGVKTFMHVRWWLWLAALCLCAPAFGQELEIARLAAPAQAHEVVSGTLDAKFEPVSSPTIYETSLQPRWWRVRVTGGVSPEGEPQLLLESPYLTRVESWRPGAAPTQHSLYGPGADHKYSARSLVIPLSEGLAPGESVYLRVMSPAVTPIHVMIASREDVTSADVGYVAWRTMAISSLVVLAILSLAFWSGVGDRSFVFLSFFLAGSALYIAAMGGELRAIPGLGDLVASGPGPARVIACLSVAASNAFMHVYLDLRHQAPLLARMLRWLTIVMGAFAVCNMVSEWHGLATIGNLLIILSATLVFVAAVVTTFRGYRAARFVLVSWVPMIVFIILRAFQQMGLYEGPPWLSHGLSASFAMAGLLLTMGLADKLLQLRHDRDAASMAASTDGLTGALNRRAIEDRLREEIEIANARQRPLSLAFVDIDHFKRINDTHGHNVGDDCLRFIGMRMHNRLRSSDALGRFGGDELLVVMPDTALEAALSRSKQMCAAINCRPLSIDGLLINGTLSVGVAQLRHGEAMPQLIARADAALYASKAGGRDQARSEPFLQASEQGAA